MNASTPLQSLAPQNTLPLDDKLHPSKTNPRKRKGFDAQSLDELAQSIKNVGVLQPILVRPIEYPPKSKPAIRPAVSWPFPIPLDAKPKAETPAPTPQTGHYEIVAGERRFRASGIAGLKEIPVIIRTLTDIEVLEIQLIENKQREDLDELEEAEGYEKLMQEKDSDGNPYTAERIAAAMGVSKATIYARLKLLALCPEARTAFYDGELDASRALLIARIPVHKLQLQALKEILRKMGYGTNNITQGEPAMSYRRARDYVQEKFMLDLERAPFSVKDAALLPKAGSCTDCLKRTGNAVELFDDVKGKDVCTDPVCFGMKKAAHVLSIQKEAESRGDTVIVGKDAKKYIPNNWSMPEQQLNEHGYAMLDDKVPGDEKGRTWKAVLKKNKLLGPTKEGGKSVVPKTIIENPHKPGQMIETVSLEAAAKALRESGYEIALRSAAKAKNTVDPEKAKRDEEKLKQDVEQANAYRKRLFDTLHKKIEADITVLNMDGLYCLLAEHYFDKMTRNHGTDDISRFVKLYLPNLHEDADAEVALMEHIPKLTTPQQFLMLIDMLMFDEIETDQWSLDESPENMLEVAKEIGIDAKAIEKQMAAEAKAAAKPAPAKKTTKPNTQGATA